MLYHYKVLGETSVSRMGFEPMAPTLKAVSYTHLTRSGVDYGLYALLGNLLPWRAVAVESLSRFRLPCPSGLLCLPKVRLLQKSTILK